MKLKTAPYFALSCIVILVISFLLQSRILDLQIASTYLVIDFFSVGLGFIFINILLGAITFFLKGNEWKGWQYVLHFLGTNALFLISSGLLLHQTSIYFNFYTIALPILLLFFILCTSQVLLFRSLIK